MNRLALLALALTGCLPGMIGTGGGGGGSPGPDTTRTAPAVKEATLEEFVADRKDEIQRTAHRDLTVADDLLITLKDSDVQRISPLHFQFGSSLGFVGLAFAGVVDDRLCFAYEGTHGKAGTRKVQRELNERLERNPAAVYFVDDLGKLQGPAWPAPANATPLDSVTIVSDELDEKDDRVIRANVCGARPQIPDSANYMVVVQHSESARQLLDGDVASDRSKLRVNSVFLWKLVGDAGSTAATPTPPPKDAKKPQTKPAGTLPAGMSLAKATVGRGETVTVRFSPALEAPPGEKFWITIVDGGANDTAYTSYKYLTTEASIDLPGPSVAGDYEVRLHANYPTKTYNLIARARLTVR